MTRWVFNEDGWTDWIDHDGKGCPCVGWWVQVVNKGVNGVWQGIAASQGGGSWDWQTHYTPVIRYRVRKPKGAAVLEKAAQDAPLKIAEPAS